MKVDTRIEASLLRVLLDEPWDEHRPIDPDAVARYKSTLIALLEYPFTDKGIDSYQETLNPDERFPSHGEARRYIDKQIFMRRKWLDEWC